MNVLVTGASGFAGSHLIEELLARNSDVEIYGTSFGQPEFLRSLLPEKHILSVDLSKPDEVQKIIQEVKPDQIYHLAALAFVGQSFEKAAQVLTNNTLVQLYLLEAVRQLVPQARVLTIGSAEEYGPSEPQELPMKEDHPLRPINPYAVSKVSQDLLAYAFAKSYGLHILRVRPFNHIGERQTPDFAIPAFAKQIVAVERGEQSAVKVGKLSTIRDYTYVKDMVRAYTLVMEQGLVGEVYNIGSGIGYKVEDLLHQLCALSEKQVPIEYDQTRSRPFDVPEIVADNTKVRALGWKPQVSLKESLQRVLSYWRGL